MGMIRDFFAKHKPIRKILRIGIIDKGAIVLEQLIFPYGTEVAVSRDADGRIELIREPSGVIIPMFHMKRGDYYLSFDDSVDGRLSLAIGHRQSLSNLKVERIAQRVGRRWQVRLPPESNGILALRDGAKVLFQFVLPPPPAPKKRCS